jgi:hypothetical protein
VPSACHSSSRRPRAGIVTPVRSARRSTIRRTLACNEQDEPVRRVGLVAGLLLFGWGSGLAGQRHELSDVALDALLVGAIVLSLMAIAVWALQNEMRNELVLFSSLLTVTIIVAIIVAGPTSDTLRNAIPAAMMLGSALSVLAITHRTGFILTETPTPRVLCALDRRYVRVMTEGLRYVRVFSILSSLVLDLTDAEVVSDVSVRVTTLWSTVSILHPDEDVRAGRLAETSVYGHRPLLPVDDQAQLKVSGIIAYSEVRYARRATALGADIDRPETLLVHHRRTTS